MDGKRFIANVKGVGVKGVAREFYMSAKSDELTGGSWSTEIPNLGNNKYLWYRDKFTLTNGTVATTTPICDGAWEAIYNIYDINENITSYVEDVEDLKTKAQLKTDIQPINRGGTGATSVAAARKNLGLGNTSGALPITSGGTGAETAEDALENLGAAAKEHTHPFGEVLISGANWQMDETKTISNINKYTLFLIKFDGYGYPLVGIRYSTKISAIGGYASDADDHQRILIASFTINGTSVKYLSALLSHKSSGDHGSWVGPAIQYIKGLI